MARWLLVALFLATVFATPAGTAETFGIVVFASDREGEDLDLYAVNPDGTA